MYRKVFNECFAKPAVTFACFPTFHAFLEDLMKIYSHYKRTIVLMLDQFLYFILKDYIAGFSRTCYLFSKSYVVLEVQPGFEAAVLSTYLVFPSVHGDLLFYSVSSAFACGVLLSKSHSGTKLRKMHIIF